MVRIGRSVLITACLTALACGGPDAPPPMEEPALSEAPPTPAAAEPATVEEVEEAREVRPAPAPAPSDTFGVVMLAEEIAMAPSGSEWLSWHPDEVSTFAHHTGNAMWPDWGGLAPWCVQSVRADTLPTGVILERTVYFYRDAHVEIPADYALPPISEGFDGAFELCRAGLPRSPSRIRRATRRLPPP